jgi:hypothetical protein
VLATQAEAIATEVFEKDCLIRLGTVVAPWGPGKIGQPSFRVRLKLPGGRDQVLDLAYGDLVLVPLGPGEQAQGVFEPAKGMDLGEGRGRPLERTVTGGVVGILLDARGRRPFELPAERSLRVPMLRKWNDALNIYGSAKAEAVTV